MVLNPRLVPMRRQTNDWIITVYSTSSALFCPLFTIGLHPTGLGRVRHRFVSDLTTGLSGPAFVAQSETKVVDLARK
jgi:hypothetical protein